jgi:tetratricopeptide (TPR) repeat protein
MDALALHQAGRRTEAELAYRARLAVAPNDADALLGLGVLRHQAGDSAEAATLLRRAATAAPTRAECHFNLGLAEFRLGRFTDAATAFAAAARLQPAWPQPHYDLGNALHAAGQLEDAVRAYRAALKLQPDFLQAEANLGNTLTAIGRHDQAIAAYRRALRRHPNEAQLHHNLGVALKAAGDSPGAEAEFRAAIVLRPDFTEALEQLARILIAANRHKDAVPAAQGACKSAPSRADLAELLGDAHRGASQLHAAIAAYERALALSPTRHSARFGMAETLRLMRDFRAAEAIFRDLVAALPGSWLAHHDLGNALRDQGRFAEAEAEYRASLAIAETPVALNHLAAVLRDLGRLPEAQAVAERGLALAPDLDDLRYNLCITHLTAGRLREGFALYDVRFSKFQVAKLPGRAWTGQPIRGRTVLVTTEQGLGDTIQFVRYLPALADTGARVVLRAPAALMRLLAGFPGVTAVLDQAAPLPAYDYHVPLMSLPDRLGLAAPCPIPVPYLAADPGDWRARLAALPGRRVGLAWAGNPGFAADHLRSVPPSMLAPLASVPGVSFVCLQKGAIDTPPIPMPDWTGELHDLAATASLITALDLVISVDTAVAHLAGALGRPVWLLNRFDTCWRWGAEREDCLWYPTLRQFRQAAPGDWARPVSQVTTALANKSPR